MKKVKNQLRVGAVMSYINMAIGSLIPMFYMPIMLSILGQDEYGLYRLSASVTSYLSLISFGIGSAIVRYLTKYRFEGDKEGEQNMLGLFNIIFAVIAAVSFVVGTVIAINAGLVYADSLKTEESLHELQLLIFLLTINTSISFLFSPYNAVISCHERFVFLQFTNIIITVITPIVNIIILYLGFANVGMVCSSIFMNIVVMILYWMYVKHSIGIKAKYRNMPFNLIKEILFFSFWIFVANIVNQLYSTTDTLIIGAVPALATIGVAVYNVGSTFNAMMSNFTIGILNVLTPSVNKLVFTRNDPKELTDMMIRIGRIQCYIVGLVCSGFIAFGRQFLTLWVGQSYLDAYWVAIATMVPACVPLVQNVAMNVIVAQNKHRFRSLVYLFIALLNVGGTMLCVNQFGIIGAAVVTGIASIIGQGFIMNWYYWKRINLDIPRFWKNIGKMFLFPVGLCVVFLLVLSFADVNNWILLFAGIAAYTILFIAVNWKFVMNDYEKDIFRVPVKKVASIFNRKK